MNLWVSLSEMSDKIFTFFHYILIFLDVPVSVASRFLQLYLGRIYKINKPEMIICKKENKKKLPKKIKHWSSSTTS